MHELHEFAALAPLGFLLLHIALLLRGGEGEQRPKDRGNNAETVKRVEPGDVTTQACEGKNTKQNQA